MENNIFDFGKSELTHDAIISWIINGFNYPDTAKDFFDFSKKFIKSIAKDIDLEQYNKVEIKNQFSIKLPTVEDKCDNTTIAKNKFGKIDILAIFTDKGNNIRYCLIIEDKVFSGENGNQFKTYIKAFNDIQDYKIANKKYVNIVLGNYSNYLTEHVINEGWEIKTRSDILEIIPKVINSDTPEFGLLKYYRNYLIKLDSEYSSFKSIENLNDWSTFAILGFFAYYTSKFGNSDCGIVNNRSGGFCALWFERNLLKYLDKFDYNFYLQLEFKPNKKSEWYIAIKLEDLEYTLDSQLKAQNLKGKFQSIVKEYKFESLKSSKGRHLTVGRRLIVSNNLNNLEDEITEINELFNSIIVKMNQVNSM